MEDNKSALAAARKKRSPAKKKTAARSTAGKSSAKKMADPAVVTPPPSFARTTPPRMSSAGFTPLRPDTEPAERAAKPKTGNKSGGINSVLPRASTIASAENFLSGLASLAPGRLTSQVRNMAENVMEWAGTAAEMAVGATAPLVKEPTRRAALEKAGAVLRDARETAGLTASDVSAALDFSDTNLLDLAESGRVALPFEVILRLASLLARNDPLPFVMNLTRFYNPGLWKIIEQLGIGKLALNVGREREFMNIYRSYDAARQLKDDEFKLVLQFTASAFEAAVDLAMLGSPRRAIRNKGKTPDEGADKSA